MKEHLAEAIPDKIMHKKKGTAGCPLFSDVGFVPRTDRCQAQPLRCSIINGG